ncbi:TRAP transporter large permease [Alicyclobacillus sp. SO9]|uniref:TRAP transporter large permease n=1 Tax=Alicyclobacillus sp. SO9 TaxID=2665646 RepID=UPI0018E80CDA|nr:TRAP transporter large permease [Alicyclobacillus sp. SO9]QQE80564.1 TRAP transporter large permease [Alicyclobacillus sp. SO9]
MTWYFAIPLVLFVLMFIVRMPLGLGLMLTGVFYLLATGQDVGLMAENIVSKLYTQRVIIAVPLFVFTANVFNRGEITDRIFTWVNSFIAKYRGGLGHVTVIDSMIYSGMTGSSTAEAAGLGKMEISTMKKMGYDGGFSCAIAASASTLGTIIPPSIPMIWFALLSGASIGQLFLGGVVPGVLFGIALMVYVVFISYRRGYPKGESFTLREFFVSTFKAFPALLTPVILLGGIYSGAMTATGSGAVAGLYALILGVLVYRVIGWKETYELLVDTVRMTGMLTMLVAGAYMFSFIVAQQQLPNVVAHLMLGVSDNKYLFLLVINIVFLLLGMVLDTSVITLVFVPIVLPLVEQFHISLIHFGVMIVLNMMIGLSTPPYGPLLYITSAVSETPLRDVIREIWPQLIAMIIVLIVVTYIPATVTWLPNHAIAK